MLKLVQKMTVLNLEKQIISAATLFLLLSHYKMDLQGLSQQENQMCG